MQSLNERMISVCFQGKPFNIVVIQVYALTSNTKEAEVEWFYEILLFIASDLASITSPIHHWVLFLLWLYPFILSGVISPLISSSILGTYQPGEFLFQYPIILPFHTVHGVLRQEY